MFFSSLYLCVFQLCRTWSHSSYFSLFSPLESQFPAWANFCSTWIRRYLMTHRHWSRTSWTRVRAPYKITHFNFSYSHILWLPGKNPNYFCKLCFCSLLSFPGACLDDSWLYFLKQRRIFLDGIVKSLEIIWRLICKRNRADLLHVYKVHSNNKFSSLW